MNHADEGSDSMIFTERAGLNWLWGGGGKIEWQAENMEIIYREAQ
jgi:hypothetical protein